MLELVRQHQFSLFGLYTHFLGGDLVVMPSQFCAGRGERALPVDFEVLRVSFGHRSQDLTFEFGHRARLSGNRQDACPTKLGLYKVLMPKASERNKLE